MVFTKPYLWDASWPYQRYHANVSLDKLSWEPIKTSTISKDVPYEIRNMNRTNAVIFINVTVEGTLSGHDSCQLKSKYCPQSTVAPVMHIEVYFT